MSRIEIPLRHRSPGSESWSRWSPAAVDQATKLWLLFGFDLGARGPVHLGPFIDLVLVWNTGISYGLFPAGRAARPVGAARRQGRGGGLLWVWLAHAASRLTALALGLIIGGAIGNAIDRVAYGAVADFVLFHIDTPSGPSAGTCLTWLTWDRGRRDRAAVRLSWRRTPQKRPDP